MSNSIEHQIQLAESLKKSLIQIQQELFHVSNQYLNKCHEIAQEGMLSEKYQTFVNEYAGETSSAIKKVVEQIHERDIPYLEAHINWLMNGGK